MCRIIEIYKTALITIRIGWGVVNTHDFTRETSKYRNLAHGIQKEKGSTTSNHINVDNTNYIDFTCN